PLGRACSRQARPVPRPGTAVGAPSGRLIAQARSAAPLMWSRVERGAAQRLEVEMPARRSLLSTFCILLLVGYVSAIWPDNALAATGPSDFLPPSRFDVPRQVAQLYVGRYQLQSVPRAAQIRTAAMGIEINDRQQLYGVAQFSGYEQSFQSIW